MIIWWHHVEMTSWSYDIIFRGLFYVYIPPVMIMKKMISWWDDMMTLTAKLLPSLLGPKEFLCLWRAVDVKLAMIMWMIDMFKPCYDYWWKLLWIWVNTLVIPTICYNNLKVVFTHTWPCWGNPVTQDWHCQPEKGNGQHLIQDHLIFDLKCFWLNTI